MEKVWVIIGNITFIGNDVENQDALVHHIDNVVQIEVDELSSYLYNNGYEGYIIMEKFKGKIIPDFGFFNLSKIDGETN